LVVALTAPVAAKLAFVLSSEILVPCPKRLLESVSLKLPAVVVVDCATAAPATHTATHTI